MNKKISLLLIIAILIALFFTVVYVTGQKQKPGVHVQQEDIKKESGLLKSEELNSEASASQSSVQKVVISKTDNNDSDKKNVIRRGNLYTNVSNNAIPLSAIFDITQLPVNVQKSVNDIVESSDGVFLLQKHGDKVLMVVDNQKNIRHGVEFVEISTATGQKTITSLGYIDKMKDSDNDNWEYDKETGKPLKHIIYDKNGDVEYIENWNYDEQSPVKYEIKDSENRTVSIKKETVDNDSNNLRVEHLIYDKDGKTKVNVSAAYEGADVKRFTYYNADRLDDSASIFDEYEDGKKVKETVYSSDLKVRNVYTSDYSDDGQRNQIKIFDDKNNEIGQLVGK